MKQQPNHITQSKYYFKIMKQIKKYRRWLFSKKYLTYPITVAIILTITWWSTTSIINYFKLDQQLNNLNNIVQGFIDPTQKINQTNNITNIIILGIGGPGHEAPDLTDSMILISINLKTNQITLLPLPRDIWIPSIRAKLNTAYHYGLQKDPESKFILIKSAVSEITDLPIHYAVVIDFNGFTKIVNTLGGIDVSIANSFDDYKYPIPGKENAEPESERYEHIHFESGIQHMDGETALKYVRSRNAEGQEGTDLARSERQKQVIVAIKNKILNTKILLNKSKILEIQQTLGQSLITDITPDEYSAFSRIAIEFKSQNLHSYHLPVYLETENGNTASESALLIHPEPSQKYDYQWVLIPKSKNFDQIHAYITCLIQNNHPCTTAK